MDIQSLQNLPRKELQDLAKKYGLKANKKSADLITDLASIFPQKAQKVTENTMNLECTKETIEMNEAEINMEVSTLPPTMEHQLELTINDLEIGMSAKFQTHEDTHFGTIKRMNKKSLRIMQDDGTEVTLQHADITRIHLAHLEPLEEEAPPTDIAFISNESSDSVDIVEAIVEIVVVDDGIARETKEHSIKELTINDLEIGMSAKFQTHEDTHFGTIKRMNKKSLRIMQDDGTEVTLQHADITRIHLAHLDPVEGEPEATETSPSAMEEEAPNSSDKNCLESEFEEAKLIANDRCDGVDEVALPEFENFTTTQDEVIEEPEEEEQNISGITEEDVNMRSATQLSPIQEVIMTKTPRQSSCKKRASIIRSTKAQKARAEAVAEKQDRIEALLSAMKGTPQKASAGPFSFSKSVKKISEHEFGSRAAPSTSKDNDCQSTGVSSTKRPSSIHKTGWNSSFAAVSATKRPLFHSKRDSTTSTSSSKPKAADIVAISNAAKEKANAYLLAQRKAHTAKSSEKKPFKSTKMPNFKKLHEKSFENQKAITSIVKENTAVQKVMTVAMGDALGKPVVAVGSNPPPPVKDRAPLAPLEAKNPFQKIISKPSSLYGRNAFEKKPSSTPKKEGPKKAGILGTKGMDRRREGFKGSNKMDRQKRMSTHRLLAAPVEQL